jgi:protein TonB
VRYAVQPQPPVYPPRARELEVEGTVVLRVLIDATGNAERVDIKQSSRHLDLDRAAIAAAKRWRFVPARVDGQAVPAWAEIPIHFRLVD